MVAYLADSTGTTPRRSKPSSVNVPVYINCNKMNDLNMSSMIQCIHEKECQPITEHLHISVSIIMV